MSRDLEGGRRLGLRAALRPYRLPSGQPGQRCSRPSLSGRASWCYRQCWSDLGYCYCSPCGSRRAAEALLLLLGEVLLCLGEALSEDLQQPDGDLGLAVQVRKEDPAVHAETLHLIDGSNRSGAGIFAEEG